MHIIFFSQIYHEYTTSKIITITDGDSRLVYFRLRSGQCYAHFSILVHDTCVTSNNKWYIIIRIT